MTLEDLKKAKIQAMKDKDKQAVNALNIVINKIMLAGIEKKAQNLLLSEADIVSIIKKTEKELIEEKSCFEKAGRDDTVIILQQQIDSIIKFLPKMMTENEIIEVISKLQDKSVPAVMNYFKSNFSGKCDMGLVNTVLRKTI